MKKLFTFLLVAVCLVLLGKTADAQTTVTYTGMGSITCPASPTATISPSVTGLTFSQITRGAGVTCSSNGTGIAGSGFNGSLANNITNSAFFKSSITSDATVTFTVSTISVSASVSSASGSPSYSIQYDIDGGTKTVLGSFTPTTSTVAYPFTPGSPISVGAGHTLNIYYIPSTLTAGTTTARVHNNTSMTVTTSPAGLTPPSLTPSGTATVDNPFDVTFTDNPSWRGAITGITINGNSLPGAAYDKTQAGKITFTPSASSFLQTSGANQPIVITASGYSPANVSQTILAGTPTKLGITTQPTAPLANGSNLQQQPVIAIQDQYGNTTTSTANVVASVGSGSWTLGGTTTKAGVSGVATFTDLNATSTASVTGATIDFTSGSLTHIVSGTFNIPAPPTITTYVWNQTGTGSFATGSNWTPTRSTPDVADILVVNNGATTTITNVPAQTIRNFKISGNSTVSLTSTGTNALSMTDNDSALFVDAGSSLSLDGANAITLTIPTGGAGFIKGNLTTNVGSNLISVADATGLSFKSGSICTQNSSGSLFSTSGNANVIVFESGSKFTQLAGSNPFGLSQPNSKVVFNHGSLFSLQVNNIPSVSGRTYANLEINSAAFSQSPTGVAALTIDSLIITQGVLNLNLTGGVTINGNIFVATGQTLAFTPASSNTYSLTSATGTITNLGTFTVSSNAIVSIGASANYTLSNNMTNMAGNITNNGVLNLGPNSIAGTGGTFTMGATNSTLKIGHTQGLSSTAGTGAIRVTGTRTYNFTGSGNTFEYNGTSSQNTGNQFPITGTSNITNFIVSNAAGVTLDNNATITGTLTVSSGATLSIAGRTLSGNSTGALAGTGTIDLTGDITSQVTNFTNTFPGRYYLSGTNQNVTGTVTDIRINGGNAQLSGDLIVTGVLTLNGTLTVGAHTLIVNGTSISRTAGAIDASDPSAIVEFANTGVLSVSNNSFTGNISTLNMTGSGLVNVSQALTVSGTLTFGSSSGFINMGANTLTIGTSTSTPGDIVRTADPGDGHQSGSVRGTIRRWFASGTSTNKIFPFDNGSGSYSEAKINFTSITTGGTLTATFNNSGPGSLPDQGNGFYIPAPELHVNLINIAPQWWRINATDGLDVGNTGGTYDLWLRGDAVPNIVNRQFVTIIKRVNDSNPWTWSNDHHIIADSSAGPIFAFRYTGGTTFSDFGIGGNRDNPLPVELSNFTSSVSGTNVNLSWATSMETNNSGFDIERKSTLTGWTKIGNVEGHGNSNTANSYTYTDRNLSSGKYNYRLKQIDYNGNYKYYDLTNEVVIGTPSKYALIQNFPNPFNPSTSISYEIPASNFVSLKIYDMMGKEVANLVNETQDAGFYTVKFDASKLSSGIYFYKLTSDKFTATKKLMLLK